MTYTLYALFDEREPAVIRYIGFSRNAEHRYRQHLDLAGQSKQRSHKLHWIRSVLKAGARILWRTLAVVETAEEAAMLEITLISEYLQAGHPLTNGTRGGEGVQGFGGVLAPEAAARARAAMNTPEYKAARSAASSRYWSSAETRDQHREAMRLFWATPEGQAMKAQVAEKTRAKQLGRRYSAASREKMRQAKLGKPGVPRTAAWKAKIAAAQAGKTRRPWTDAERARHMAGMNHEKMSASARARRRGEANAEAVQAQGATAGSGE